MIKFLTKVVNKQKDIHRRMSAIHGNYASSDYVVNFWSEQFRLARESIEDDARMGRHLEATNSEICRKVKTMVLEDRPLKIFTIATSLLVAECIVINILHAKLDMSKDQTVVS